jgi:hypothetical protein
MVQFRGRLEFRAFWEVHVQWTVRVHGRHAPGFVYWNNFLWPLIVGNTREMATVPVGLNLFNGQHGTEWNYMMAASTISILPTAILTIALQKYIIEGNFDLGIWRTVEAAYRGVGVSAYRRLGKERETYRGVGRSASAEGTLLFDLAVMTSELAQYYNERTPH